MKCANCRSVMKTDIRDQAELLGEEGKNLTGTNNFIV